MRLGVFLLGTLTAAHCAAGQTAGISTNETGAIAAPNSYKAIQPSLPIQVGVASWYGEDHRGKLMANGKRFDPDQMTAASWFYPLGTRVRVILKTDPRVLNPQPPRSVWVTITDRGPHRRLVRNGRIIDLSHGVFRQLADPDLGLIEVLVYPEVRPQQIALRSPG